MGFCAGVDGCEAEWVVVQPYPPTHRPSIPHPQPHLLNPRRQCRLDISHYFYDHLGTIR